MEADNTIIEPEEHESQVERLENISCQKSTCIKI